MQVAGFGFGFDFGWENSSTPVISLDFTSQNYSVNGIPAALASVPGWSFARASIGTATDSLGVIHNFISGDPRIVDRGLLIEGFITNKFLNSAIGSTQNITTTAASWTLSFYGTGTITLTGGATGTLVGTGTNNRVSLTVTATAATTTLTVSGSTTNVQFAQEFFASSYVPTAGSTVTRQSDLARISGMSIPVSPFTITFEVLTASASDPVNFQSFYSMSVGASAANRLFSFVDTDGISNWQISPNAPAFAPSPVIKAAGSTIVKSATSFDGTNYVGAINGVLLPASSGSPVSGPYSQLDIGVNISQVKPLNGFVRRISISSTVSSGPQLQSLTT